MLDDGQDSAARSIDDPERGGEEPIGRAVVAGAAAAALAGIVWALIVILTDYEVGFVAWAVGGIVGVAMARATDARGPRLALLAVVLAAGGLVLGKGLTVYYGLRPALASEIAADSMWLADAAIWDLESKGQLPEDIRVALDTTTTFGGAASDSLFLALARAGLDHARGMSPEEREQLARDYASTLIADIGLFELLRTQMGIWDVLWFGLALTTAWKLMAGTEPAAAQAPEAEPPSEAE